MTNLFLERKATIEKNMRTLLNTFFKFNVPMLDDKTSSTCRVEIINNFYA